MSKPVLTIGIIFKDNIRSIERCLSALQPLRDSVPCELVMADTGSTDGSRQVAERYADILFDFPWINDFAAARNAVMDRASGKWFLTVDSDEYLDEDISGLKAFLTRTDKEIGRATVVQRNYLTYEMDDRYTDTPIIRLLRMSTGMRYRGRIHEVWKNPGGRNVPIGVCPGTILHHDGYVEIQDNPDAEKIRRNAALLRERVAEEPENLLVRLQLVESSLNRPELWDIIHQAMELVDTKKNDWELVGPPLIRHAVVQADIQKRLDIEEWIKKAETMFPDSLFTRIDVQHVVCSRLWEQENYAEFIARAEDYLQAMEDYRAGRDLGARMCSFMQKVLPANELTIKLHLADAYVKVGQVEHALELLERVEIGKLDAGQVEEFMIVLRNLHAKSFLDTAPLLIAAWESVNAPESAPERRKAFLRPCGAAFARENRENEALSYEVCRPAYTMLLPLEGKCELGRAAAILEENDPQAMAEKLSQVERWEEFPIHALAWVLEQGVPFPPAGKKFRREELETLVSRLSGDRENIFALARKAMEGDLPENLRDLFWKQELVLAAIRVYSWDAGEQGEDQILAFARGFARLEGAYLPRFYSPDILRDENIFLLPSLHRLGWYCFQAFSALDAGDAVGYTKMLRKGLHAYEAARPMVEFLMQHTPQLAPTPSEELRVLADQIRGILAQFPPDHPTVMSLKASEAYQKVASLIEGIDPPVAGGQLQ